MVTVFTKFNRRFFLNIIQHILEKLVCLANYRILYYSILKYIRIILIFDTGCGRETKIPPKI